ncbi:hypothetical protein CAC42_3264 [Sphaceloma murrayae]|uniref:Uncharacterized protein n=1 Tax=Sphaceloma murrayae TaxID=2082308 RepID=A0A2K1QFW8_9PEZI|nr:hypothetical protein CAC42_3264 [Sphaceloma murrayae]
MNRFLSKKKADDSRSGSIASTSSRESKKWKKGKRAQEEPAPQLDLKTALPTNDEFRTSLILPNLSMRFSMLREQDDPTSKLGKASDDSVLQPKRQSRLPDFGFSGSRGLGDIAEVASVSSSVRPPWLTRQHDSFVSDDSYGADADSSQNGSVMNRARPGEGNVLFGGRQKVYKIASSKSTKSLAGDSQMGKVVYEDDLSLSAFQKFKQAEKDAAALKAFDEAESSDSNSVPFGLASSSAAMSHSPKLQAATIPDLSSRSPDMSSQQRQASIDSSNASEHTQDRNSTPATSVASHTSPASTSFLSKAKTSNPAPLERSLTKRRLYEQSLDQSRQEQQVSALTRLNSIQKQRNYSGTTSPPPILSQPKSTSNLQQAERSFQPYAVRPQSPTEVLTTFESINKANAQFPSPSPPSSHPQSPTFIPLNEYDEMNPLSSTLQPGDRGKATAMNAFQMPRQPFDEAQYLQRLQQLQQPATSPKQDLAHEEHKPTNSPPLTRFDSARQAADDLPTPTAPRARSLSQPSQPDPPNAFSVFQRAAAQMRGEQSEEQRGKEDEESVADTHRTFFGDISASDDDDDDILSDFDRRGYYGPGRFRPGELANIQEHPGGRTPTPMFPEIKEEDEDEEDEYTAPPQPLQTFASKPSLADSAQGHPDPAKDEDDILLPAEAYRPEEQSRPLGGLIHQHLRNTSNVSSAPSAAATRDMSSNHLRNVSDQSSVYTNTIGQENSAPSLSDATSRFTQRTYTSDNRLDSTYTNSNPWDLDDFDSSYYYGTPEAKKTPNPAAPTQDSRALAPASSKAIIDSNSQATSETSAWLPDHKRDLSAGTLLEREAFEKDIAARQKAIQENLKSIIEVDPQSRGSSPQPTQSGAFKAFGMLKPKTSRDSMVKQEQPTKAMKMLGIGAGGSQTSLPLSRKTSAVNDEIKAPSDKFPSFSNSPRPSFSQRTPPMGDQKTRGMFDMQRPRGDSEASMSRMPLGRPSPPSTSAGPQSRTRSNSQASSLRNPVRAERPVEIDRRPSDQQVPEGIIRPGASPMASSQTFSPSFSPSFTTGFSPQFTAQFSPQHSPNLTQSTSNTSDPGRARSTSRSAMNSPIEPPMSMLQASMSQISMSQASMSNTSLSHASTMPQASMPPMPSYRTVPTQNPSAPPPTAFKAGPITVPSPRPSPMPSPYYANPTPPASGNSTPVSYGPATPTMPNIPNIKQGGSLLRKKTVSKSEISDPILISSTSNVDTVDLPPGASLRNGMEPPPIPPVNPRRRATKKLFGLGSKQEAASASRYPNPGSPPPIPTSAPRRVVSPEPYMDRSMEQSYRSASAQGHRPAPRAMRSTEGFERPSFPVQGAPQRPIMTEGGMF